MEGLLSGIWTLILFIIILGLIVLIHELGHFTFAKLSHTYIYEFAIGMGKKLFSFRRKNDETEYSIRLIPIGGYNAIAGENGDEDNDVPKDRLMNNKSFLQRFSILVAGPVFNFILTFVLLFISALIYGSSTTKAIVGDIKEDYPAYLAGIRNGDTITKINGKSIKTWDKAIIYIQTGDNQEVEFTLIDKDGNEKVVKVTPKEEKDEDGNVSYVYGISKDNTIDKSFAGSLKYAWNKTGSLFGTMLYTVKCLFTGGVSVGDLSGPVGIYSIVGEQAKGGLESLIYLTAYLSINIGVINLIPFPAFDGGRILFLFIEKITGKPLKPSVENAINTIGFLLILGLICYVSFHDIVRLFK